MDILWVCYTYIHFRKSNYILLILAELTLKKECGNSFWMSKNYF